VEEKKPINLIVALWGIVFHSSAIFFTLEMHDALIHLFSPIIAYGWFERNYSWYTGFYRYGYPLGPSDDRITVLSGRFKDWDVYRCRSRGNIIP
jgi:hypothetical protein